MPVTFISVLRTGFYKTVKQKRLKSDEGLPRKATKKNRRKISFNGGNTYSWQATGRELKKKTQTNHSCLATEKSG